MLKDRTKLDEKIRLFFSKNYADKEKTDIIKEAMTRKGYSLGKITRFINLSIAPEGLPEIDAGILAMAITLADSTFLNYKDFWNEKEIDRIEKYIKPKKSKDTTMTFNNITEIMKDYFICPKVTLEELQEWFQINYLLGYDPDLQRELVRIKDKNDIISKIKPNNKKTDAIAEKILNNEMHPTNLVFYIRNKNAFIDKYKNISINREKRILEISINEDTEALIIDGWSRIMGAMKALALNETLNRKLTSSFIVTIALINDEMAGDYIKQINEQTPIDMNKIEVMGSKNNPYINITKRINEAMNSLDNALYHKFAETNDELKTDNTKLCLFTTFAKAIEFNFYKNRKPNNAKELQDLMDFLIKGFNEIIGDLQSLQKNKFIAMNPNSFIGYIAMLSKLQNDNDWKEKIYVILSDIDFSNKNENWIKINYFARIINNSVIKKISEFFIERSNVE